MSPVVVVPTEILVVRLSSIGGVLLTTPLLRALRHRHPEARLTVLTDERYAPLLKHNPNVDQVAGVGPKASLWAWARSLRQHEFGCLLDLEGSVQSRLLRRLVPGRWRRAERRWLAERVLIHTKRNLFAEAPSDAERYFTAAKDLDVVPDGLPVEFCLSEAADAEATKWLDQAGIRVDGPLVAFAPGALAATLRWPADFWVDLITRVTDTGADAVCCGWARRRHSGNGHRGQERRPRRELGGAIEPSGHGSHLEASAGGDYGRQRYAPHGDRRRDAGGGVVWPHSAGIRPVPVPGPRHGRGARSPVPTLQQAGGPYAPAPAS
ncbi:MAG: lipopolysaccharide heptosyltransferase family protein [Gemmatimonadales bacterium]|nr:MAG: lipopolysaccharide heptosyltransferase family protein [Gemmatimonadales bacterium]